MNGTVVLVPSCDAYADLWPPFFRAVVRHWKDCPFSIVLGSNQAIFDVPRGRVIHSTAGLRWGERLLDFLSQLQCDYVLLMLEDFFLRGPVDTARVIGLERHCRAEGWDMLRLAARPPPPITRNGEEWGAIDASRPYAICTQPTLWKREFLISIVRAEDSIWEFEMKAARRLPAGAQLFGVYTDALPYRGLFHHTVEKGMWIPSEYWLARSRGLVFERDRPLMPWMMFLTYIISEKLEANGLTRLFKRMVRRLSPQWLIARVRKVRHTPDKLAEAFDQCQKP